MNLYSLKDKTKEEILALIKRANEFKQGEKPNLVGTIACIFIEPSTRTYFSYRRAAQKSGLDVLDFNVGNSSFKKGETLEDTIFNLEALGIDKFIIRTGESEYWQHFEKEHMIANGGDGESNHPSQALLDAMTIYNKFGTLDGLNILIAGDTKHSRVYHSFRDLIEKFDSTLESFTPDVLGGEGTDITKHIAGKDVVMMLRVQHERHATKASIDGYNPQFGLNDDNIKLLKEGAIFMHPGPINRDIEITSSLLYDHPQNLVLEQVSNGMYMRMAILELMCKNM